MASITVVSAGRRSGKTLQMNELKKWQQRAIDAESKLAKCREALEFYADRENWLKEQDQEPSKIMADSGKLAQQTLKETSAEAIAECIDAGGEGMSDQVKPHPAGLRPVRIKDGNGAVMVCYFHAWQSSREHGAYNCTEHKYERIDEVTYAVVEDAQGKVLFFRNDLYEFQFLDAEGGE